MASSIHVFPIRTADWTISSEGFYEFVREWGSGTKHVFQVSKNEDGGSGVANDIGIKYKSKKITLTSALGFDGTLKIIWE